MAIITLNGYKLECDQNNCHFSAQVDKLENARKAGWCKLELSDIDTPRRFWATVICPDCYERIKNYLAKGRHL